MNEIRNAQDQLMAAIAVSLVIPMNCLHIITVRVRRETHPALSR